METKEKIIRTATNLFKERGIKLTAIDSICHENKISKKTFYQYFKDKEALVNLVYEETFKQYYFIIKNINLDSNNSIESTLQISEALFEFFENFDEKMVTDISILYPFIWKKYLFNNEVLIHELLLPNIKAGVEKGYYKTHLNKFSTGIFWLNLILMSKKIESSQMNNLGKLFFLKGLLTEKGMKEYFNFVQ